MSSRGDLDDCYWLCACRRGSKAKCSAHLDKRSILFQRSWHALQPLFLDKQRHRRAAIPPQARGFVLTRALGVFLLWLCLLWWSVACRCVCARSSYFPGPICLNHGYHHGNCKNTLASERWRARQSRLDKMFVVHLNARRIVAFCYLIPAVVSRLIRLPFNHPTDSAVKIIISVGICISSFTLFSVESVWIFFFHVITTALHQWSPRLGSLMSGRAARLTCPPWQTCEETLMLCKSECIEAVTWLPVGSVCLSEEPITLCFGPYACISTHRKIARGSVKHIQKI